MSIANDAYVALVAGLTTKKNEKEILYDDEYGFEITVEILDAHKESYIVRKYYGNGQVIFEDSYLEDQLHGQCISYYEDGQISSKHSFNKGLRHGVWRSYHEDGILRYEENYLNDVLQ